MDPRTELEYKSKPFLLQHLFPINKDLGIDELSRIYAKNIRYLKRIFYCYAIVLFFYALLPGFSSSLFVFFTILHIVKIISLYLDPVEQILYKVSFGVCFSCISPVIMATTGQFIACSLVLSGGLPGIFLFSSRLSKIGIFMSVLEVFKSYFIYPGIVSDIFSNMEPDEQSQFVQNELKFGCLIIVPLFLVLRYFFNILIEIQANIQKTEIEVIQANKSLKDSLKEREAFILAFSHEIRNPLNAVIGSLDIALESSQSKKTQNCIKNCQLSAKILHSFINNILDIGKESLNQLEVQPKRTNLYKTFVTIWESCKSIITSKGYQEILEFRTSIPRYIFIDPYRLSQIIFNLIGNACKPKPKKHHVMLSIAWRTLARNNSSQELLQLHAVDQSEDLHYSRVKTRPDDECENFININLKTHHFQNTKPFPGKGDSYNQLEDEGSIENDDNQIVECEKQEDYNMNDIDELALNPGSLSRQKKRDSDGFEPLKRQKSSIRRGESNKQKIYQEKENQSTDQFKLTTPNLLNLEEDKQQIITPPEIFDTQEDGILEIEITEFGTSLSDEEISMLNCNLNELHQKSSTSELGPNLSLFITKKICDKIDATFKVRTQENSGTKYMVQIKTRSSCLGQLKMLHADSSSNFIDGIVLDSYGISNKNISPTGKQTENRYNEKSQEQKNLVIVEDEKLNSSIIAAFAKKAGFNVLKVAENGQEAVDYFLHCQRNKIKIDLITLDIEMPIMKGKEAAQKIRQHELLRDIPKTPLAFISGNCVQEEIQACLDQKGLVQALDFIKKPVQYKDIENLAEKLRDLSF